MNIRPTNPVELGMALDHGEQIERVCHSVWPDHVLVLMDSLYMEMHRPRLRYTAGVVDLGRTDWLVSHVPCGNYAMLAILLDQLSKRLYQYERFLYPHQTDNRPTFHDHRIDSTSALANGSLELLPMVPDPCRNRTNRYQSLKGSNWYGAKKKCRNAI